MKDKDKKTRDTATEEQIKNAEERTLNKVLAYMFIDSADRTRYANVAVYL